MTLFRIQQFLTAIYGHLNRLQPLWWLALRIWIAAIFFKSGLTKIEDFETTLLLFEDEYAVPLISPYFAAISATFFELVMPIALVFGFATRLAAIPLLVMTAIIQLTYLDHLQHYYWAAILLGLILHGAGRLSIDAGIQKWRTLKFLALSSV